MSRIPTSKWISNSLPELMNHRLGEQGHSHLAVADVQVEGASPLPTEVLIELEKLLDMPAFGELLSHCWQLRTIGATKKALELILLGPLAGALHKLKAPDLIGPDQVRVLGCRVTSPLRLE